MTLALIQGSPEWFDARRGCVTASRVADVIAKTKTGWGTSRANYMAELIAERLTGVTADRFTNSAMQWGTNNEPLARAAYEFYQDEEVQEVAFVEHLTIKMVGASPDGLIGKSGLVEIKNPNTATHIDTLLSEKIPAKYITQMQFQMACTERLWCDYVSYDSRLPADLALFVKRVDRDGTRIAELETMVIEFLAELDELVARLNALRVKDKPEDRSESLA